MGCNDSITKFKAVAGATVPLMFRAYNPEDGEFLTLEQVESVRIDLFNSDAEPVDAEGDTITDGSAYDEPDINYTVMPENTVDSRWTKDSVGYNVIVNISLPFEDVFTCKVTVVTTQGSVIIKKFEGTAY